MAAINSRRVWLGALVGGIVFFVWSMVVEFGLSAVLVGQARMDIAGMNQWFLKEPRVPVAVFFVVWTLAVSHRLRAVVGVRAPARQRRRGTRDGRQARPRRRLRRGLPAGVRALGVPAAERALRHHVDDRDGHRLHPDRARRGLDVPGTGAGLTAAARQSP